MDDVISESILTSTKKGNILKNFFALGRHFGISLILSLQAYRSTLGSVMRNQMTIVCIGRINN